jgi:LPXTG-motif cell wall-anchored protein
VGTYTAQVTVRADHIADRTFTVTQVVSPRPGTLRTVRLLVFDAQQKLPGAALAIGGNLYTADGEGSISLSLPEGTYAFTLDKTGYTQVRGALTVDWDMQQLILMLPAGQSILYDQDGSTDAFLVAGSGAVPDTAILVVDETGAAAADHEALRRHSQDLQILNLFDIRLLLGSTAIQPDAPVRVAIPVPPGMEGKTLQVVRINDDGTVTVFETQQVLGMLYFTTDHFSRYAIVGDAQDVPQTGESAANWLLPAALLLSALTLVFAALRRRQTR